MALGIFHVQEWLSTLEPGDLDGWIAYYSLEPWDKPQAATTAPQDSGGPRMMTMREAAMRANGIGPR